MEYHYRHLKQIRKVKNGMRLLRHAGRGMQLWYIEPIAIRQQVTHAQWPCLYTCIIIKLAVLMEIPWLMIEKGL